MSAREDRQPWRRTVPGWLRAVTATALIIIVVVGTFFYREQQQAMRAEAEEQLATVALIKAEEVARWREFRVADGQRIFLSLTAHDIVETWLADPSEERSARMRRWLEANREGGRYTAVEVVDSAGRPLISTSDDTAPHPCLVECLGTALEERPVVLSHLHPMPDGAALHFDVIVPMFQGGGSAAAADAFVVLRADDSDLLQVVDRPWLLPSHTAETLLVERSDDEVLVLSAASRAGTDQAGVRIPLDQTDVPSVQAALGAEGIFEGVDYAGTPVLAYVTSIPDSEWAIVAKVDLDEALADWRVRSRLLLAVGAAAAALVLGAALLVAWQLRVSSYAARLELERSQRLAQEHLITTMRSIGDAVISTDASGGVEFMNPVAERMTGWTQAEARGLPHDEVFRIVHEQTRQAVESPVEVVMREGRVVDLANHTVLLARDGAEWPIADSAAPIRDEGGEPTGAVLVFRDQSEERAAKEALERSERRHRLLFEHLEAGFALHEMIFDDDGRPADYRFLQVNPAFERMTGLSARDIIGKTMLEMLPGNQPAWVERYGEVVLTGRPMTFEDYSLELKRHYHVIAYSPDSGQFATVFSDITERKARDAELERYRVRLEGLVEERTVELSRANEELREASAAKSRLLANMSHELRTPLNAIIGFSGILMQGISGDLNDEQMTQVRTVNQSGKHLLALINEVLDLAKIEAGCTEVRIDSFDPAAVVAEVVSTLAPMALEKEIALEADTSAAGAALMSDHGKVRQILLNLAGNAVKFTDAGRVTVRFERDDDGDARFTVVDTGPGIPLDALDSIFEPFVQADHSNSGAKPDGTGLGLSISREFARMLGGDLTVRSEVGKGSTFTLVVPDLAE